MESSDDKLVVAGEKSWAMTLSILATFISVGVAFSLLGGAHAGGGYAPLVGLLAVLAGVNMVSFAVWMEDNPAARRAALAGVRRHLALVGIVAASSAVTAVAAVVSVPAAGFGLFVLLLSGVCLVMMVVLGS